MAELETWIARLELAPLFAFDTETTDLNVMNAQKWFENLILLMDKDLEAKEEIKMVEVSESFSMLNLASESCDFQFNLKAALEKVSQMRRSSEARNTRTSLLSLEVSHGNS